MHKFFLLFLIGIFMIMFSSRVASSFSRNLGDVILHQALWQDGQRAPERQAMLAQVASYYAQILDNVEESPFVSKMDYPDSMIASIVAAEYYRRQQDFYQTVMFLDYAAMASPRPLIQKPLIFPVAVDLSLDGSIILRGNSPFWEVRPDTKVDAQITRDLGGEVTLRFKNRSTELNRAVLSWKYPMNIPYHHQLRLEVRVSKGCSLIVETVIDGQRVRHQLYSDSNKIHVGSDEWEQLLFAVEGTKLQFVDLLLTLDSAGQWSNIADCTMEVASTAFVLDNTNLLR